MRLVSALVAEIREHESSAGRRVVYLMDAASPLERRLLERWIDDHPLPGGGNGNQAVSIPPSRRARRRRLDGRLEACLAVDDDPLLAPLRVAWMPGGEQGGPGRRLSKLLLLGDPRDPGLLRQAWMRWRRPERSQIVFGEAAPVSELRERWRRAGGSGAGETTGLAEFVARQAALTLERAERRLRGMRYKVPRFVHEDILARPAFRGGLARLAREIGRTEADVRREAERDLREVAATHSPYVIDVAAQLIRLLYSQGYGGVHYDRVQLERIYALAQRHPVVFLPSHKSNLDHLVLQYALHENGHPPNHTAGGINMNFFPVGPLVRRSGVFFIRRTFKDDAIYKFVLRHYIDYLIEKRFSLEWYLEGGRSRSGKLLPPRFGMLAYVVDAYRGGRSDDVVLIPVAIAYDQIQDVGDYTAEARGARKPRESFGWFVSVVRGLRRRYGDIHLRFGEPLSLAAALGPPVPGAEPDADEQNLAVQKLAFQVSDRINRVTPITPTSLVTLAMLGRGDRAMSVAEIVQALGNLLWYVRQRGLPTTVPLDLDNPDGVRAVLDTLVDSGVVTCYAAGADPVYAIGPEKHLTAAYYRNTIIHFFVNGAIAEVALLGAAEAPGPDLRAAFWEEAMRLRDLLKFEFFFAERDRFRADVRDEVALHEPAWEEQLRLGATAAQAVLRRFRPFNAHRVLRPFLEAYQVVGDALARDAGAAPLAEPAFVSDCLALGTQYRLQRRIQSEESVSRVLFETALRLARNRRLLDVGTPELDVRRLVFATEIRDVLRRVDAIDVLAASRRAGLIE
ncbi:MAG: glycerol-3-phosphate 1-O-acyltransferase [Candidatus Binatia bacterium]